MHTAYFYCLLAALLSLHKSAQAQPGTLPNRLSDRVKIDSVFKENLFSLARKAAHKQSLSGPEIDFCYVVSCMSGLDFNVESYAGTPILVPADVKRFAEWYHQFRDKITWENYQKGIGWLHQSLYIRPEDDDSAEKLETLRIQ